MKSLILRAFCIALICILCNPIYASNCDEIEKIALKCLDRRLSPMEHQYIGGCEAPDAKEKLINYILDNDDFIGRLVLIMRLELLQGTTEDKLREDLQDFDLIMFTQPDNYDWAKYESEKLYKVYHLSGDYLNDKITFQDFYITYFDNWAYDQQNMGLDNFINSTFSYAIGRSPTKAEYKNAKQMLVENESHLFYEKGSSKRDYLRILTNNDNFLEKQVKYWHYYFLYEYPDNKEIYTILKSIKKKKGEVEILDIIRYLITNKLKV